MSSQDAACGVLYIKTEQLAISPGDLNYTEILFVYEIGIKMMQVRTPQQCKLLTPSVSFEPTRRASKLPCPQSLMLLCALVLHRHHKDLPVNPYVLIKCHRTADVFDLVWQVT